jgi:uncharacterized protein YbjT (DUF2867 family)
MKNRAVIVGASGLVGSHLLELLLKNDLFEEIRSFSRKKLNIIHPRLLQFEINFDSLNDYSDLFSGNIMFCCIGTTIKKAGSKQNFQHIDYEIPVRLAQIAAQNHFDTFVVISSLGANSNSSNFYLKTKGKMQQFVENQNIPRKIFIQPSLLLGKRVEFRFGERFGEIALRTFGFLLIGRMRKYRAIRARNVAQAMVNISLDNNIFGVIPSDTIEKIADIH